MKDDKLYLIHIGECLDALRGMLSQVRRPFIKIQ
jgi:hypothetical protein